MRRTLVATALAAVLASGLTAAAVAFAGGSGGGLTHSRTIHVWSTRSPTR